MGEPNMQIEKKKIDHVTVKKTIGEISQNAGKQKRKRHIAPNIMWPPPDQEQQDDEKRDRWNRNEESIVVSEGAERRASVGDVHQMEEVGYYDARLVWANEPEHQVFRPLIERIKRHWQEENKFHLDLTIPPDRVESGRVSRFIKKNKTESLSGAEKLGT